jgi:heme/copper-type cytochrome/quinol oxidase subunit 4
MSDRPYLRGFITLLVLAVLTWIEFQVSSQLIWLLALIGIAKAAIILQYFMHIYRLRSKVQ